MSASGGTPDAARDGRRQRGESCRFTSRRATRSTSSASWIQTSGRSLCRRRREPRSSPSQLIASTRHEGGPQFSPDGARIAFHSDRTGSFEIWVCDAVGSNLVQLTSFGGPLVGTPRWSPDGRRLAFDVSCETDTSDIHVIDRRRRSPDDSVTTEPFIRGGGELVDRTASGSTLHRTARGVSRSGKCQPTADDVDPDHESKGDSQPSNRATASTCTTAKGVEVTVVMESRRERRRGSGSHRVSQRSLLGLLGAGEYAASTSWTPRVPPAARSEIPEL